MEVMLSLAGIALGLYILFCPIVAWVTAINARNRIKALEQTVGELKASMISLTRERAASSSQTQADTVVGQAVADVSSPAGNAASHATGVMGPAATPQGNGGGVTQAPELTELEASLVVFSSAAEMSATRADTATQPGTWDEGVRQSLAPESNQPTESPALWVAQTEAFVKVWLDKLRLWLFGGNLVAKMGLLILFLGVSFLLKYTAQRISIPIEFRLAGIVLADIALLVWAWRIRGSRAAISLPVQGVAVAILMLVTFGAYKLYALIPGNVAFLLLFVLTAFTALLAVLQDAVWLAVFGIVGGFAAPILTSTEGGSHIGLFSYYVMLNAGILAIALYRSWRLLNLLGFAFTFVIGTAWGVLRYTPEHYLSVQWFLILFFAFYVSIALLYAYKQAPKLTHYVDGTLVFGTPLLAFGLQYGLVKGVPFGLAYSSLCLGLFYIATATWLSRRGGGQLRLLTEAFLALGIVFGTLAIPFALDGRWTSAAWALEGAGMVWVGLRQRQTTAWVFGLLVQFGAWVSFLGAVADIDAASVMQANLWLGFLLLAATAFLMAINFKAQAEHSRPVDFTLLASLFLGLAAVWMLAGAWTEILLRTDGARQANLLAFSGLFVAALLGFIAWRMHWWVARVFALAAQMLAGLVFLLLALARFDVVVGEPGGNLFAGPFLGALLIGFGAAASSLFLHRQGDLAMTQWSNRLLAWAGFWWFGFVLREWAGWLQGQYQWVLAIEYHDADGLFWCAYGLSLAAFGPVFANLATRLHWPALRWFGASVWLALGLSSLSILGDLYVIDHFPRREVWWAYLALWVVGEWLLAFWLKQWTLETLWLRAVHTLRTVGPWLLIWPVGRHWIAYWLESGTPTQQQLLVEAGWFTSGSWSRYLPAWVMMLVLVGVIRQARIAAWPCLSIPGWYRQVLIPLGALWSVFLVLVWNLTQNGRMSPLPYLPVLNPLDLTTGFSLLLAVEVFRLLREENACAAHSDWYTKAPWVAALSGYAWFNLMLLRSVAVYRDIPYQFATLFAAQFVQTLLSLVWSATALMLMRIAAQRVLRKPWMLGAGLLAIVVGKLFLVDLSNVGGFERIVSFVGVGLLMLAIGYLAPFPTETGNPSDEKKSI